MLAAAYHAPRRAARRHGCAIHAGRPLRGRGRRRRRRKPGGALVRRGGAERPCRRAGRIRHHAVQRARRGEGRGRRPHIGSQRAANADNPAAQLRLARILAEGRGVPRTTAAAARWYLIAKERGMEDDVHGELAGQTRSGDARQTAPADADEWAVAAPRRLQAVAAGRRRAGGQRRE